MPLVATASQTVGPFFNLGLDWPGAERLAGEGVPGQRIEIAGRVLDGDGQPVPDALLELWQADAEGRYAHPLDQRNWPASGFLGFGRCGTDEAGQFRFLTIKPGTVSAPTGEPQAPHILAGIFARGLLARLITRIYFADEAANERDPVLQLVEADRRGTLLARPQGAGRYEWNVTLQGEQETVFFQY